MPAKDIFEIGAIAGSLESGPDIRGRISSRSSRYLAIGPGVDLLSEDAEDRNGNPDDAAVMELSQKGINFRVCANTLSAKYLAKERILDNATIVPSGLSEIARLQLKKAMHT